MIRTGIATAVGSMSALIWDTAGPSAPWLHFAHATGMNARVYARLLDPLADRFRIVASDARGHGHSRLPADPAALETWRVYAADLLALIDAIDARASWLLAGHSMGAAVSALAAAHAPSRVAGLVLADPAMVPFALAPAYAAARAAGTPPPNPMADQAARRRAVFASRGEARTAYKGRGMFANWADADLDAYLDGGLRAAADGVVLGCAPAWEAATFRAVTTAVAPAMDRLRCPFALVAGDEGSTVTTADFATLAALPTCRSAERLPGTGHFVPLERPDAVRAAIEIVAAASRR